MTRSQRIKQLVKLSENKERKAAQEFAAAQKILNDYQKRLEQLQHYRQEYLNYLKPGSARLSIKIIREQKAFIAQIDEGIRMLKEQIKVQQTMNFNERDNWLKQKKQLDTMENIFQRLHKTEQQIFEMREQLQLDEFSQRQHH